MTSDLSGEMPEWLNGAVSKTTVPLTGYPGFESQSLRQRTFLSRAYRPSSPVSSERFCPFIAIGHGLPVVFVPLRPFRLSRRLRRPSAVPVFVVIVVVIVVGRSLSTCISAILAVHGGRH